MAVELHVSIRGNDANSGTKEAPFQTIQAAANVAKPGDIILVAPGIYRERVSPPIGGSEGHPIVFRSEIKQKAIIRGSDVWTPEWQRETSDIWSGEVDSALFKDDSQIDGANPFEIPFSCTPRGREGLPEKSRGNAKADGAISYNLGQVFVDSAMYIQMPSKSEMEAQPGSWFYQKAARRLYVHFFKDGPQGRLIEITTRRRIFAPHDRGLGFIEVDGFVMEHCGNQYPLNLSQKDHPEWQQAGALGTRSGHDWVIQNNTIRLASGLGMDLGEEGAAMVNLEGGRPKAAVRAGRHVVENNYVLDNGVGGIASYNASGLVMRANVVVGNNAWGFTGAKSTESAGIKLYAPDHSVIEDNYIAYNVGRWGMYFSGGAGEDTLVIGNLLIGHEVGIQFETGMADPTLVANNVFIENKAGIEIRESGGLTISHNLFLGTEYNAVKTSADPKREGNWSAANVIVINNIMSGKGPLMETTPPDFFRSQGRIFDNNVYESITSDKRLLGASDRRFKIAGGNSDGLTLQGWQEAWKKIQGEHGTDQKSILSPRIFYTFDSSLNKLVVLFPFNPAAVGERFDERLKKDYYDNPLPKGGKAFPGPFQKILEGRNEFQLWSGLSIPRQRSPWAKP